MESTQFDKSLFFGKVTASVAHDLQNVLAVIKETSGLMIEIEDCDPLPLILTDPLVFQILIFKSIQYLGGLAAKESVLKLFVNNNSGLNININRTSDIMTDPSEQQVLWQSLGQTCQAMNAEIKISEIPVTLTLNFSS